MVSAAIGAGRGGALSLTISGRVLSISKGTLEAAVQP